VREQEIMTTKDLPAQRAITVHQEVSLLLIQNVQQAHTLKEKIYGLLTNAQSVLLENTVLKVQLLLI
jgi:hypothetical protein